MSRSTVADTSLQAYLQKKKDGSLEGDKKRVYKIIKEHGPISIKETAKRMGKFPNEISGRFGSELKNEHDLIEEAGVENGETLWQVKKQNE